MSFDTILTKEFLIENYFNKHKSYREIGNLVGCSNNTIKVYMQKYSLSSRRINSLHIPNLIGQKFGKLTILERDNDYKTKNKSIYWKCKCDCGQLLSRAFCNLNRHKQQMCSECKKQNSSIKNNKGFQEIKGDFWSSIKTCAKNRNLNFEITIEQAWNLFLKQDRKCALSNISIYFAPRGKRQKGNISLDRIDSTKGYTIDNIQWIHKDLNIIKNNYTDKEFIDWCYKVADYQRSKI